MGSENSAINTIKHTQDKADNNYYNLVNAHIAMVNEIFQMGLHFLKLTIQYFVEVQIFRKVMGFDSVSNQITRKHMFI